MFTKSDSITKAGIVKIKETRKGIQFYAFNHERQKELCIGTLSGRTYEKTAPILRQPEPSFCLPPSELAAVEREGGQFIRFIARGDKYGTFSISVQDFHRFGERYYARGYGEQIRVSLTRFAYSPRVQKRTPRLDNPPVETPAPILRDHQPRLFG